VNWHIFQRARVRAGLSFVLSAPVLLFALQGALPDATPPAPAATAAPSGPDGAAAPPTTSVREVPTTSVVELYGVLATYALMLGGALTYAVIRWLNKVGQNVPRDPTRTQQQIAEIGAHTHEQIAALSAFTRDQLSSVDDRIDSLQALVGAVDRRTSRLEGYVRAFANAPVIVNDDTERGDA